MEGKVRISDERRLGCLRRILLRRQHVRRRSDGHRKVFKCWTFSRLVCHQSDPCICRSKGRKSMRTIYIFASLSFFHFFQTFTPDAWQSACHSLWWPFEDNQCHQIRCLSCSAAVISAKMICKSNQSLVHSCMQRVRFASR